jgi:hypothetical protein
VDAVRQGTLWEVSLPDAEPSINQYSTIMLVNAGRNSSPRSAADWVFQKARKRGFLGVKSGFFGQKKGQKTRFTVTH